MKCPVCSRSELVSEKRSWPLSYKRKATQVPDVDAQWCDACGEALTGPVESKRIMEAIKVFRKQVDAG